MGGVWPVRGGPPGPAGARPCARRRRVSSPQKRARSRATGPHHAGRVPTTPGRIDPLRQVIVIGGRGDRQNPADRLDPVLPSLILDEPDHHFDRRSSSAIAKYALALRRISFAWRSSRVLSLQRLQPVGHLGRNAYPRAAVDLGPLDPLIERVRCASDLRRDRHDRLPTRPMLAFVVQDHPYGTLAHFGGKLVRRLAHDAPSSGVRASGKPGAVHIPRFRLVQQPDPTEKLGGHRHLHYNLGCHRRTPVTLGRLPD